MEREDYILNEYMYSSLMALRDFAENAFVGYSEEHGQKEEQELAITFTWLVKDVIDLFDASKQTVDDYIELHQHYQKLKI